MAIGRTEDRNTPGNPLGHRPHRDVWGPIRVTHLGPRSTWPHIKAGHMTAIDQTRPSCKKVLAGRGPSTQGFRMPAGRDYSRAALGAGVRKPPRKEPAGRRVDGCRLWGFDGAAAWVGDALAGVVGGSDDRGSEFT